MGWGWKLLSAREKGLLLSVAMGVDLLLVVAMGGDLLVSVRLVGWLWKQKSLLIHQPQNGPCG